jgi:hypothetical protein
MGRRRVVMKRVVLVVVVGLLGTVLFGCAETADRRSESYVSTYRDPGTIALIPFLVSRPERDDQRLVKVPGFERFVSTGDIAPEAREAMTSLFRRKLTSTGYELVSQTQVQRALGSMGALKMTPNDIAQRLSSELRADSVLMGWVFRYEERVGNAWGARDPASVAFSALLFNGSDGRLLWRGRFDETQRPLSENILRAGTFMKRGGRWLTARELAADGVNGMFLSFPGEKKGGVER